MDGALKPPVDAARVDDHLGRREPGHARLFQIWRVPARRISSAFAASVGVDYRPPEWNIVLPVGISFYTFATLCYTLDVYLKRAKPAKHFLDYALFVTFFPHLVAGPIMRPTELVPQFAEPAAPLRTSSISASR